MDNYECKMCYILHYFIVTETTQVMDVMFYYSLKRTKSGYYVIGIKDIV